MTPGCKLLYCLVLFGALLDAVKAAGADCFLAKGECPNVNISFYLRTKDKQDGILVTLDTIERAPFVEGLPLVVLIHGYTGDRLYSPNMELVPAFLKHGGYNILTVDWGKMARVGCYIQAAFNVELAGRCSAHFLRRLYELRGPQWKLVTHIIGFSLGAHVSGVLGHYLPGLPRITGLDPALPLFSTYTSKADYRLDAADADFVDVYHSNAGWKGRVSPVGHLDFYINNGRLQPGCIANTSCDHVRAVEIFAESINTPTGFYGVPCQVGVTAFLAGITKDACKFLPNESNIEVLGGEFADSSSRGTYRFDTNNVPPYAKGSNSSSSHSNSNFEESHFSFLDSNSTSGGSNLTFHINNNTLEENNTSPQHNHT